MLSHFHTVTSYWGVRIEQATPVLFLLLQVKVSAVKKAFWTLKKHLANI